MSKQANYHPLNTRGVMMSHYFEMEGNCPASVRCPFELYIEVSMSGSLPSGHQSYIIITIIVNITRQTVTIIAQER